MIKDMNASNTEENVLTFNVVFSKDDDGTDQQHYVPTVKSRSYRWKNTDRPVIERLYICEGVHRGNYTPAFILACCSAEHAYRAIKGVPKYKYIEKWKAIKYIMNVWYDHHGDTYLSRFKNSKWLNEKLFREEVYKITNQIFLNPLKHEGYAYEFSHERFKGKSKGGIDSQMMWYVESGSIQELHDTMMLSREIYNLGWHCLTIIEGIDIAYKQSLTTKVGNQ